MNHRSNSNSDHNSPNTVQSLPAGSLPDPPRGWTPGPFPHERLDAFRLARQALILGEALARTLPRGYGKLADQLRRAHQRDLQQIKPESPRRELGGKYGGVVPSTPSHMSSPRTVICCPDPSVVRAWASPLAATGSSVDFADHPAAVDPQVDLLWVLLPKGDTAFAEQLRKQLGTLSETAAVCIALEDPDILQMVAEQRHPAVRATVGKAYLTDSLLAYISAKILWGNIFGVSKRLSWGARVQTEIVGSQDERISALASLNRFASSLRIRAKHRDALGIVADELLMNALYDAPIDAQGRQLFEDVSPRERTSLRLEQPAVMQFGSDGTRLAIAVRDSFGSIRRDTVLNYLEHCARSSEQIERKTAGAGLGLYLVANHVSEFVVHLFPGVATEVVCVLDLQAGRQQLRHFGFFEEAVRAVAEADTRSERPKLIGGMAGAAAPPLRLSARLLQLTLGTAVALLLVAAFLLAWPYLSRPKLASLTVRTEPAQAMVYVNGIQQGKASPEILVDKLRPDQTYVVTAELPGYAEGRTIVQPRVNENNVVVVALKEERGELRILSTPTGASVMLDGKDTGLKTPTLLTDLDPEREYKVALILHGFFPSEDAVKPAANQTLRYHASLSPAAGFATLDLDSTPSGARLVINEVDTGLTTPISGHALRVGPVYSVKLMAPGRVPWERRWEPKTGAHERWSAVLPVGGWVTITANVPGSVTVGGVRYDLPLKRQLIAEGRHRVIVSAAPSGTPLVFGLTVAAGAEVEHSALFGFVSSKDKEWQIKIGDRAPVDTLALRPGKHKVTLVHSVSKQTRTVEVDVKPDGRHPVSVGESSPAS